jgi:predicted enzyme related to lactoylglutathione lyase
LMTTDPEAGGKFYSAVVPGWKFGERVAADMDYRMIGRSDGGNAGGVLKLTDEMQQHGARPMWLGYVHVPDVDDTVRRIEAKGGKSLMPAWDQPGVGRLAMIADPQGAPLYLMDPIPPASDPNAKSDVFAAMTGERVNWNEISTSDTEAALDFYRELFGWGSDEAMDMGENGKYRFIDHHGQRLGAMFRTMDGGNPRWRFYFGVPSIAQAVEAVNAGGGKVTNGAHEVPGGGNIIIGIDPQGAEFALVGGK